jgi:hypothetical protein
MYCYITSCLEVAMNSSIATLPFAFHFISFHFISFHFVPSAMRTYVHNILRHHVIIRAIWRKK